MGAGVIAQRNNLDCWRGEAGRIVAGHVRWAILTSQSWANMPALHSAVAPLTRTTK